MWNKKPVVFSRHSMAVSLQDISDNGPTLKSSATTKLGEVEFWCPTEGEFIFHGH